MNDFVTAPRGLSEWLICGACVLWMIGLGIDLAAKLRGKPGQPPNEEMGKDIARLGDEVTQERLERERAIKEEREKRAEADQELHGRITANSEKMHELLGQLRQEH
jgi:hypothetical protein